MKRTRSHIWHRSIVQAKDGTWWVGGVGTRADFVVDLFMKGWSIAEICDGLCDGYMTPEQVEDAIRYGIWKTTRLHRKGNDHG